MIDTIPAGLHCILCAVQAFCFCGWLWFILWKEWFFHDCWQYELFKSRLNCSTTSSRQTYEMKIFYEWTFPREHCTPMKRSNCDKREIILGGNLIVPCGVTKEHQNLINTRFWYLATFSPGFHSAFSLILKNLFFFSQWKNPKPENKNYILHLRHRHCKA